MDWLITDFRPLPHQVQYFKKRRVMEHQREQTLQKLKAEGAQEMPGVIGAGAPGQKP